MTRAIRLFLACAALVITAAVLTGAASARTVWLCQPGHSPDPCNVGLSTTVFSPTLHKLKVIHPARVKKPAIDCFYVYPTVSDQSTPLANLHIDPEERSVALYPGGPVLPVLPRLRADVPAGDALGSVLREADVQAGRDPAQRRPRRVRHLPAQVQPWARVRAHRPLPGLVRPRAADRQGHRSQAGGPQAACLRAAVRRQRARQAREGHRRHLPARARVPVGDATRLCDRVLDV